MQLYRELKRIYDDKQAHKTDRAMPRQRNCRVDSPSKGVYRVKLYGHTIITAYPDYMEVSNGGWATQTTHDRLWSIARVSVRNDSKCGYRDTYRIYDPYRGASLPFSGSVRIHYNTRMIYTEDVKSDFKRHTCREATTAFSRLHKSVWRKLVARVELGEFEPVEARWGAGRNKLAALQRMADAEFPTEEDVLEFLAPTHGYGTRMVDKYIWDAAVRAVRAEYYEKNDGYYYEEIEHV